MKRSNRDARDPWSGELSFEFCYTPKHGSWLNIAENELSSLTRQCVAGRRFADVPTLREETEAWSTDVTATQRGVDWQMKIDDARTKLKSVYPTIILRAGKIEALASGVA